MRTWSTYVPLFVITSAFAVQLGCGGDDDATPPIVESDGGIDQADSGGPSPDPGPDDGTDAGTDSGTDAGADADAGPPVVAGRILGYAFSNSPAADESTPSASFAYNASGGDMTVTRNSTGLYTVKFAGLGPLDGSVALVSAYDMPGGLCHWGSSTGDEVKVRCLNAAGSVADAKFVVTVFGQGTKGATILGFAHADDESSASYTPQASRSNNAVGGGAITATRTATGVYKMDFGGVGLNDLENVQVMPYGDPSARCMIKSWGGSTVKVECYDSAMNAVDAQYAIFIAGEKPGGTAKVVAYANANDEENASYAPTLAYNAGGGAVAATRSGEGTYSMAFEGLTLDVGAHVQATSQGKGRRCNVGAWAGTTVDLTCTRAGGTVADSNYALVVLQ